MIIYIALLQQKKRILFVGNFNIDACSKSRFLQILLEYDQLVEFPAYIAGSTSDQHQRSLLEG